MEIRLFLRTIYQEYPDNYTYCNVDNINTDKLSSEWMEYWQYHYSRYQKMPLSKDENKHNLKLRKEPIGGFIFDPFTTAIFWADDSAFEIISMLQTNTNLKEIRRKNNICEQDLSSFISKLTSLGLW